MAVDSRRVRGSIRAGPSTDSGMKAVTALGTVKEMLGSAASSDITPNWDIVIDEWLPVEMKVDDKGEA